MRDVHTVTSRAIKLFLMFDAGRQLTCKDVEKALGVKRHSAMNYIDSVGVFLSIYESGKRQGDNGGPPAIVYEVMK